MYMSIVPMPMFKQVATPSPHTDLLTTRIECFDSQHHRLGPDGYALLS